MTSSDRQRRVAVIGLGIMGSAMARNVVAAGFPTTVWNRSASAATPLVELGATSAEQAEDAVREADVVITMLPDAAAVTSVMIDGHVLEALAPGALWAQMGTIGVQATIDLAAAVQSARPDVLFVDAPVSGSKGPAEQAQLLVLASGPDEAPEVVDPVFAALGRKTQWVGPAGAGSRLKLVVNGWLAFLVEGAAETLALADRVGIGHDELTAALEGGPLASGLGMAKLAKMVSGHYDPEFPLAWALKDVDLCNAEAGEPPLPVLSAISQQWHVAVDQGLGRQDISAARRALQPG
ncbi:MAG TPA: NAD(P)-dependent oxidoreductase [Acidimicrobiales bacterium]